MDEPQYIDVEQTTCLVRRATSSHSELGQVISRLFQELADANPATEIVSAPMVVYTSWQPQECEIEAAFPVELSTVPGAGSELKTYPACTALFSTHYGSLSGLPEAWMGLWRYVEENHVEVSMPCWDTYVKPPVPTESDAVTEIYIPLKVF